MLFSRGIPIVFTTGYGKRPPGPWLNAPTIDKPFAKETVLRAIKQALLAD
jgi:hypothetical protein